MSGSKTVTFPAEQVTLSVKNPRGESATNLRAPDLGDSVPALHVQRWRSTPCPSHNLSHQPCWQTHRSLSVPSSQISHTIQPQSLLEFTGLDLSEQSILQLLFSCVLLFSFTEQYLWIQFSYMYCSLLFPEKSLPFWPTVLKQNQNKQTHTKPQMKTKCTQTNQNTSPPPNSLPVCYHLYYHLYYHLTISKPGMCNTWMKQKHFF